VLRSAPALLLAPESWLRMVFVLTGAALALALGIADFTIVSLVATAGTPAWATALVGVVLVGGPLLVGLVPAVRQVEGVAVQSLLVAEFPDGPPGAAAGWPQRRRTLGWFLLHVFTGALVVAQAAVGSVTCQGEGRPGRVIERYGDRPAHPEARHGEFMAGGVRRDQGEFPHRDRAFRIPDHGHYPVRAHDRGNFRIERLCGPFDRHQPDRGFGPG